MKISKNKKITLIASIIASTISFGSFAEVNKFQSFQNKSFVEIKEENPDQKVRFFYLKLNDNYNNSEILNILNNIYNETGIALKYRKKIKENYISVIGSYYDYNDFKNNIMFSYEILDLEEDRIIRTPVLKNNMKEDLTYLRKDDNYYQNSNENNENNDFNLLTIDDEPEYSNQYYMEPYSTYSGASNIRAAIDLVYPLDPEENKVNISVVDVGYAAHEELINNIKGGYKFSTIYYDEEFPETERYRRGSNYKDIGEFDDGTGTFVECVNGHGTEVSSIITADVENSKGIAGIVDADLYMPKALDYDCTQYTEAYGLESDIADSVVWSSGGTIEGVTDIEEVADVINLSLGRSSSPGCSSILQEAVNYAVDRNSIVVASAGNEDKDVFSYTPSGCNNIITVAGNDLTGLKVDSSNWGSPLVDFSVLGENITIADPLSGQSSYKTGEGTSLSASIVSGIAGLFKQKFKYISQKEFEYYLKETANPHNTNFSNSSEDCTTGRCGAGIVDAEKALKLAEIKINYAKTIDSYFANRNTCEDNIIKEAMEYYVNICRIYNISVTNPDETEDSYYEIISKDKSDEHWIIDPVSQDQSSNIFLERRVETEVIGAEKEIFINNVNPEIRDYAIRMCDNDRCYAQTILDFEDTENEKPLRCQ